RGRMVHIVCTGSGFDFRRRDYFGQVKNYVDDHALGEQVHFTGLLPRAEQIAILRRSLAVLQPSRFEGWSTVIEDAKSLGKPCVARDLPGHRAHLGARHPWYVPPDVAAR